MQLDCKGHCLHTAVKIDAVIANSNGESSGRTASDDDAARQGRSASSTDLGSVSRAGAWQLVARGPSAAGLTRIMSSLAG